MNIKNNLLLPSSKPFSLFVKQTKDNFYYWRFVVICRMVTTKLLTKKYCRTELFWRFLRLIKVYFEVDYTNGWLDYIVQNPVKAKLVSKVEEWKYSTASEVAVQDKEGISDVDELIKIYGSSEKFKASFGWVNSNDNIDTSFLLNNTRRLWRYF